MARQKKDPTEKLSAKRQKKEKNAVVPVKKQIDESIISSIVLRGDISGLDETQKAKYNIELCKSLGLNPYVQPFQIIKFQGSETLYATKTATEQLRKVYGVSVTSLDRQIINDICIVTANVSDSTGRMDASTGAVNIKGLFGDNFANAIMKAETKAKRRATLSICGLGMLDETEIETIPGNKQLTTITGEIVQNGNTSPVVDPMTIEEACKKLRAATNMRGLVMVAQEIKNSSWNSDDREQMLSVYREMESKFKGEYNV